MFRRKKTVYTFISGSIGWVRKQPSPNKQIASGLEAASNLEEQQVKVKGVGEVVHVGVAADFYSFVYLVVPFFIDWYSVISYFVH